MAQWLTVRNDSWFASANITPLVWRPDMDDMGAAVYARWGHPPDLLLARGKTLRGYLIRQRHENGGLRTSWDVSGLYLAQGAFPQPEYSFPASAEGLGLGSIKTASVPDQRRPIGRFSNDPADYVIGSPNWPGLFTNGWMERIVGQTPGTDYAVNLRILEFKLLLDDAPTWTAEGAAAVVVGGFANRTYYLRWPDGSPVVGERLRILAGTRTQVRLATSEFNPPSWALATEGVTGADGKVTFQIRGNLAGTDWLKTYVRDDHRIHLYASPLEDDFEFIIVGGTGPEPPPPVCVDYPEQLAVEAQPARLEVTPVFEWNSGANSFAQVAGDAQLRFTMPSVVAAIVGFAPPPDDAGQPPPSDHTRISHGFLLSTTPAGAPQAQQIEHGTLRSAPFTYVPNTTVFTLQRSAETVSYRVNDVRVGTSRLSSAGPLVTATALYATGDTVPPDSPAP